MTVLYILLIKFMKKIFKIFIALMVLVVGCFIGFSQIAKAQFSLPTFLTSILAAGEENGQVDNEAVGVVALFSDTQEYAHANEGGDVCDVCCKTGSVKCKQGLTCENSGDKCSVADKIDVGTCQVPGKITFCSLSTHKDLDDLINAIMKWILIFGLTMAPLMIVLGGFFMITSQGDPKSTAKGKEIIKWALIGLAVILFAKAFTSIITSVIK